MRAELAVEADVLEMLLDVGLRERPVVHALHHVDLHVDLLHVLAPHLLLERLRGDPLQVLGLVDARPLDRVLELLRLVLAALAREALDHALELGDLARLLVLDRDLDRLFHHRALLVSHDHRVLHDRLLVLAARVAPADVLVRRLVEVVLDVVERVLA